MRMTRRLLALLAALALVAAACGDSDDDESASTTTAAEADGGGGTETDIVACFVTDDAGVDDRSFNAAGWAGVEGGAAAGYVQPDPILLESDSEADYQPHIEQCLSQGSTHIVTNGFKLGPTTQQFAEANPEITWTIVDFGYDPDIPNVRELVYQTDEGAFAAGYLAAGVTQTGTVGTYGGVNIPTVSIFMDGFARGVAYYNEVKGTDVDVVGWDVDTQDGSFTGTFDPGDPIVRSTCEGILDEGADIVLPVGGAINNPCGTAILDRGLDAALIGTDTDAFFAQPEALQDVWLVTILKGIELQVTRSLEADFDGTWSAGGTVGNLANGAIGLSEYHSWADRVPDELDAEVQQILTDIANGDMDVATFVVG